MRARLTDEVERIRGREVIAFMSDNHTDPDYHVPWAGTPVEGT